VVEEEVEGPATPTNVESQPTRIPKEGEFVLAHNLEFPFSCYVGEVMETREHEGGAVKVVVYGTWYDARSKPFWLHRYKKGWIDTRSDKVLFQHPKKQKFYRAYEQWVELKDVISVFEPHWGQEHPDPRKGGEGGYDVGEG
jgi:hypothetical protein